MLGRKRNILFAIMALTGSIVFAAFFGVMSIVNYLGRNPNISWGSIGLFMCALFIWRALKAIKYIFRKPKPTEPEEKLS